MKASVKVMRSYDYCHFEIALSSDDEMDLDQINDLRKQAAILVDEAVRQYKIAKKAEESRQRHDWDADRAINKAKALYEKPKSEWSIEEAAFMRSYEERSFWADIEKDYYCYGDEPERDLHFSMLSKFRETRISAIGSQPITKQERKTNS